MGQAAVDLPDPLQQSTNPNALNADDLLSRLAGEEIDRLLAEADVDAPARGDTVAAPASPPALATIAPGRVAPGVEPDAPVAPAPAPVVSAAALEEFAADDASKLIAPLVADRSPANIFAVSPSPAPGSLEESPLAQEDRAVLDEVLSAHAEAADEDRLPLFLRPLEWLNAPLQIFPEAAREALGKVAIITLFNSLAVLAYVLIFRASGN
jgi:hypothetical protein